MTKEGCTTTNIKRRVIIVAVLLFAMALGTSELTCYVQKDVWIPEVWTLAAVSILTMAAVVYLIYDRRTIFENSFHVFFIPVLFCISCILLFVADGTFGFAFYLISGILFAKYIGIHFGLFIVFDLIFLAQMLHGYSIPVAVMHLVLSVLLCVLFPYVKNVLTGLYLMVSEAAVGVALFLVLHLLQTEQIKMQLFPIVVSYVILAAICLGFSLLYEKKAIKDTVDVHALLSACEETAEAIAESKTQPPAEIALFDTVLTSETEKLAVAGTEQETGVQTELPTALEENVTSDAITETATHITEPQWAVINEAAEEGKAEEELRKAFEKAEEEAAKKAAQEARKEAEEATKKAVEEAVKKATEEARKEAEEVTKKAVEKAKKEAEKAAKKATEKAKKEAEKATKKAVEKARKEAVEEAKKAAEEARIAEIEVAQKANEEAKKAEEAYQQILSEITNEKAPLLVRAKKENKKLFAHLQEVAEVAFEAADAISANPLLAMAGGYYHEIGKLSMNKATNPVSNQIYTETYIENGLRLAEEAELPEQVKALIQEHNVKYHLPKSPEAAIVMLTDTILTTIQFLEASAPGKVKMDKVISQSMHLRLTKGDLNEAGLSMTQYKELYEFYMQYFQKNK